jgi:hypothetical protein
MSEYFHNISAYNFNDSEENIKSYSIEKLIDRFNSVYPHLDSEDYYFKKFGIVPPEKFDYEKKYIHQCVNNVHFIKLRFNDINVWDKILSEIFKKDVVIIRNEKKDDENLLELYNKVKREYKLPINYYEYLEMDGSLKYYELCVDVEEYKKEWCKKGLCEKVKSLTKEEYMEEVISVYVVKIKVSSSSYVDEGCRCVWCIKKRDNALKLYKLTGKLSKVKHEGEREVKKVSIKKLRMCLC